MTDLIINSKIRDYKVKFADTFDFLEELAKIHNYILIIDKNVYSLYKKIINKNFKKDNILVIEAIEDNKTIYKVIEIYGHLINRAVKRNATIISLGGGIIQDITGFVASTLYRGVNWIFIPTTLLSQADSCIGSKTSLNFETYKNLIGTFYPPTEIYINVVELWKKENPRINENFIAYDSESYADKMLAYDTYYNGFLTG